MVQDSKGSLPEFGSPREILRARDRPNCEPIKEFFVFFEIFLLKYLPSGA